MNKILDLTGQRFGKLIAVRGFRENGYTKWECICDCGAMTIVHSSSLKKENGTRSCGNPGCIVRSLRYDLQGQRFGFLVAILFERNFSNGKSGWKCQCDCGNITYFASNTLWSGKVLSCGCKTTELFSLKRTLPGDQAIVNSAYNSYKQSAKRRNIKFDLSIDLFTKFVHQKCNYCGSEPMQIARKINGRSAPKMAFLNGIDRINNDEGYIISNCVSCCRICNRAKSNESNEQFSIWLKNLVSFRKELKE